MKEKGKKEQEKGIWEKEERNKGMKKITHRPWAMGARWGADLSIDVNADGLT